LTVDAVFWDFGGVITTSPFDAFGRYEEEHGLPAGFIRQLNATNPDTNAWAAFERGQLDLDGFVERFEAEAVGAGATLDARAVVAAVRGQIRPVMAEAVRRCHDRMTTALLTNNFTMADGAADLDHGHTTLMDAFDVVVESSRAGCRKPDPRFYQLACELADVEPNRVVFLDDLGINLKPARAMGMTTIKVTDPDVALAELESVVGFSLTE
jgi:putative hydrolase of the HAD superfamily